MLSLLGTEEGGRRLFDPPYDHEARALEAILGAEPEPVPVVTTTRRPRGAAPSGRPGDATPAYRKTIPCTLQLMRIRHRLAAERAFATQAPS